MAGRIRCYADTSAFIALLDKSDSHHSLFRQLFSVPPCLETSALVVAEGHGWFLRRYDRRRAVQFLAFLDELPKLEIWPFDSGAVSASSAVVRKFIDQDLTLADAHGISIMQRGRFDHCWSTDWHLSLADVPLVH